MEGRTLPFVNDTLIYLFVRIIINRLGVLLRRFGVLTSPGGCETRRALRLNRVLPRNEHVCNKRRVVRTASSGSITRWQLSRGDDAAVVILRGSSKEVLILTCNTTHNMNNVPLGMLVIPDFTAHNFQQELRTVTAAARIEINILDLNFVNPEEISTAQAREYLSQAQLVVSC